jgi:hypothetical protein
MVALSLLLHVLVLLGLLHLGRLWLTLASQNKKPLSLSFWIQKICRPPEEADLVSEVDSRDGG